jgi:predicted amidophosphoribosyltransferase
VPCLACARPDGPICITCAGALRPAPARALGAGVVARAAWSHGGTGRRLVQRLKYDGVTAVVAVAVSAVGSPPANGHVLVPIPRVLVRRVAYGVDPARQFAEALGHAWDLPVVPALGAPPWAPRRAGRRRRPGPPALRATGPVPGAIVVDDVITSGSTVRLAAQLVGARHAVALTMAAKSPGTPGGLHTMGGAHHG